MFEIELPLRLVSESNRGGEHWSKKHGRHTLQKSIVVKMMKQCDIKPPCKITLTRIAPRMLDGHDNLASSFKWVTDAIAASLTGDNRPGRADGHPGLFFAYNQEKKGVREYAIKIRIESFGWICRDANHISTLTGLAMNKNQDILIKELIEEEEFPNFSPEI